ncbi:restriction endonuclease subunit S [Streptomyces sp. NBC_00291]|uniref:restriction endonuclease subunit S n=1 Tax=Streptomyces sp. NBC_00291 TaxID=2975704 RepID=UPI00224E0E62|nr:restriction endonuclease subunit S [Streptomyces sp. NBC_00291]MCX5155575.1 restriction endonuclease subunit S [Streptomyces sp. NBC_00291]
MNTTVVPEGWATIRLGWLFKSISDRGHEAATVLSVYRDHGVVPKGSRTDNFNRTPENLSNYQLVRPGDLVVNRMKAWQGSLGISEYEGIVSPDYEVLRPSTSGTDHRFVHSLLRSRGLIDQYALRSTGIRPSQWRLYWDEMKTIEVSLPSVGEQRAIADYLDRETARIDTLIEEQQQLIERLRERRAAVISHAVLDVTSVRTQLRRVVDVIDCAHVTAEFVDDDHRYPVASIRECQGATVDLSGCNYTTAEFFNHLRASGRAPHPGDLLFIRNVSVGLVSVVTSDLPGFAVGQETVLLRRRREIDPSFLRYALIGAEARHAIESAMIGSTFRRINVSAIRALPVPIPSLDEQRCIVVQLNEQTAMIDTLIEETERFIELSRERRSALITAAVTGRIDVREVA